MHADEVSFTMGQPTFMFAGYTNCSAPGWSGYDAGCRDCHYDAGEAAFARHVGRAWSNMAASGDVNSRAECTVGSQAPCGQQGAWPAFGGGGVPRNAVLHPSPGGGAFPIEPEPDFCKFWDAQAAVTGRSGSRPRKHSTPRPPRRRHVL